MSEQHTPAPWEFGKDRRWLFRDDLKHGGNFSSSTVLKIDDDAFRPSEADARLIAVAPELLDACQWMQEFIEAVNEDRVSQDQRDLYTSMMKLASAAIAKARGIA